MSQRGLFKPGVGTWQPRKWSDIHEVVPADMENPITDFESAVKMYDSMIRLDLNFHEKRAVNSVTNCIFSMKEERGNKMIINIDNEWMDFTLDVNDHVFIETLRQVDGVEKRNRYATGIVSNVTKHQVEVIIYQYCYKVEIGADEQVFVCNKVNYGMYADQLKALDVVKVDINIMQKLAYGEQIVSESESDNQDDILSIPFDTDQKLALKQLTNDATTTFVLTGPPGTGKTTVLIEAILKLVERGKRALVATSSNIAADVFTNRFLKQFNDHQRVFRLMKATRDLSKIDDKVKAISGFEKFGDEWEYRPPDSVEGYSVVITTLGMSYKLRTMCGVPFSHIFIEEAGEASELNLWMFLANHGIDENTRLVLSGDKTIIGPQNDVEQLNKYNSAYKKSMLQRLVEHPQFKSDSRLMVSFSKNYRSHESIVDIMSSMFDDPIIANENYFDDFDVSSITPQASSRVIFHNVKSECEEMKQISEYHVKFLLWCGPRQPHCVLNCLLFDP